MFPGLDYLRELNFLSIVVRILLAMLVGGIIGWERASHPAGLRTHILVCIGSSMVMLLSHYLTIVYGDSSDISRIGAQVISGIGFLGAGTILFSRGKVTGLTTAAGLWSTACIGLCIGIGFYEAAVFGVAAVVFALFWLQRLSHKTQKKDTLDLVIFLDEVERLRSVDAYFQSCKVRVSDLEIKTLQDEKYKAAASVTVGLPEKDVKDIVLDGLRQLDCIYVLELNG